MATNKVIYNGTTLIDLTSDTVDASHLASGYTAHDKAGNVIVGEMSGGGATVSKMTVTGSNSTTLTITGLASKPLFFALQSISNTTLSSTRTCTSFVGNGSASDGTVAYKSGNNAYNYHYSSTVYSSSYSNGTLTLKSTTSGGQFRGSYTLTYAY